MSSLSRSSRNPKNPRCAKCFLPFPLRCGSCSYMVPVLQLRSVIRAITLITLLYTDHPQIVNYFVSTKKDLRCVRRRTFLTFEEGHSVCSKNDILCVRRRTFLVFEEGHSVCSKEDSVCSKQDIPCVANKRFRVFWSLIMHMPFFGEFNQSSQDLGES